MKTRTNRTVAGWIAVCAAACLFALSTGCEPAAPSQVLPPGEHPRLLFTKAELPAIRRRARTERGRQLMDNIRLIAYGGPQQATLKALKERDPQWLDWARKQSARSQLGATTIPMRMAAFLAIVTDDPQDQYLARELFRLRLDAAGPVDQIEPKATWGCAETAMAYDMVYHLLNDEERAKARKIIAATIGQPTLERFDIDWWLDGPNPVGRPMGNWTTINVGNLGLSALAIEGEPGYNPELFRRVLGTFRQSMDHGIAPDGGMYEGTSYASGYGTRQVPYLLKALERRGIDLASTTHVTRVPRWLAHELLPWRRGECFPINKAPGFVARGGFPTWLGVNAGSLGRLIFENLASDAPIYQADPVVALVCGFPNKPSTRFDRLPTAHWFSTLGYSYHRTGWDDDATHMVFTSNNIGSGHTHADNGSFAIVGRHAYLAVDGGGPGGYASDWHNLVHIDGKGQARQESSVQAFVRSVETTRYADIIDVDLADAYSRYLDAKWNSTTPRLFKPYNPVQHAERRIAFIRGLAAPIVALADDLQKDDAGHDYDWMLHTLPTNDLAVDGRRFTITQWYAGPYLRTAAPGKTIEWTREEVPAGSYRGWLLVRSEPAPHQGWAGNSGQINGVRTFSESARATFEKWPPVANHMGVPHRAVDGSLAPEADILFGRNGYRDGWQWIGLVFGEDQKPAVDVTDGKLSVRLTSAAGGRVAAAVFTRNADFAPGRAVPAEGNGTIVLTADKARSDWQRSVERSARLTGMMCGREAPTLSAAAQGKAALPKLIARKRAVRGRFLAVMAVSTTDEKVDLVRFNPDDPRVVMIDAERTTDYVGGIADGDALAGEFATDAMLASVSVDRRIHGTDPQRYSLVDGRQLTFCGVPLVESEGGGGAVTVINDGQVLVVRGRGAASVTCRRMTARTLRVNGVDTPMPVAEGDNVTVAIPTLPTRWSVAVSRDGRTVTATGNGPQPLKVHAPEAVEFVVNGISRYFSRDNRGNVYPVLDRGIVVIKPDGSADTTQLRSAR